MPERMGKMVTSQQEKKCVKDNGVILLRCLGGNTIPSMRVLLALLAGLGYRVGEDASGLQGWHLQCRED